MEGSLAKILTLMATMVYTTQGQFHLMEQWGKNCASLKGNNVANNSAIIGWPCIKGAGYETFITTNAGSQLDSQGETEQIYTFKNPISGLCLTITGGGVNNAVVNQFQCQTGALNQQWVMTAFSGTSLLTQIKNPQSGRCLTTNYNTAGQSLTVYDCLHAPGDLGTPPNQWWTLY